MGFVEDALLQIKAGDHRSAARTLTEYVNDPDLKESARIGVIEWIGECYQKSDEPGEAAAWYEKAGRSALESKSLSPLDRRKKALQDFERAMDCFKASNNIEGIRRISVLKYSLSQP